MTTRRTVHRRALWAFAAALLLQSAMPLLATASARLQGKALADVCPVYGVALPTAVGTGLYGHAMPGDGDGMRHRHGAGDGTLHLHGHGHGPEAVHGADPMAVALHGGAEGHAAGGAHPAPHDAHGAHAGDHCALLALAAMATPGADAPALPGALAAASRRDAPRASPAPRDPVAEWVAGRKHGPPGRA